MKRIPAVLAVFALLLSLASAFAESAPAEIPMTTKINVHFADVAEGQERMRARTLFHDQISVSTLPFFLQRKEGTLEDYIEYSAGQVLAFTPEEEQRITGVMDWLQGVLEKHGLQVPDPGTITFVKTTCHETLGAAGYTSEGAVFLNGYVLSPDMYSDQQIRELVVHELFHCMTRQFPAFRSAMYSLIHFTVLDDDIEIPAEIREQIIANPDVEHHNSYATFTIGREQVDCYLVFLTDSVFEKPGDDFFSGMYTGVVPLDGSRIYRTVDVKDFWNVVGRNTTYAEDPEEIMATNFASAISHLDSGYGAFKNPEILQGIVDTLRAAE